MNIKKTRRKFIEELGTLSTGAVFLKTPIGILVNAVVSSAITRSMAEAAGYNPRRYINIQFPDAPPRWMFDLMLNAYGTTDSLSLNNSMVGTRYVANNGRYTSLEYKTVLSHGVRVPWVWQFDVPAPGNAFRPMSDLLDNLLVLQGITTENPGHQGSKRLHFRPTGSTTSLGALSADHSDMYIPAVNLSADDFIFSSLKGKSAVTLQNSGNMLENLLNPFISAASSDFKSNKGKVSLKSALSAASSALDSMSQSEKLNNQSLIQSQISAENLINSSFGNLTTEWNTLLNKYKDLVTRSLNLTLPGINDLPVGDATPSSRLADYQLDGQIVKFTDLRELMNSTNLKVLNMAEQFAITEYILKNNLSYSITMSMGTVVGLKTGAGLNTKSYSRFDEHTTGQMPSLLINTLMNVALSSCLLELINVLKTKDYWKDTVIDIGGEFNRSARTDGTGSDHGYEGKSVTLLSGAFTSPLVLGNVSAATGANAWGLGATVTQLGRQLKLNDMASTIAYLLRTPSPVTSATSLVSLNETTNQLIPSIELARRL